MVLTMQPTNLDLKIALDKHASDDASFQENDAAYKETINKTLVGMQKSIDALTSATADSVDATRNFKMGISFIKFSGKNIIQIGAFSGAIYGIYEILKIVLISIVRP